MFADLECTNNLVPQQNVDRVTKAAVFGESLQLCEVRGDEFPCLAHSGIEAEALYSNG